MIMTRQLLSPRIARRKLTRLATAGWVVAACVVLLPLPCRAETGTAGAPAPATGKSEPSPAAVTEASQRYDRGLKLYSEGEYRLAVIEFERAYELVPDHRVLYNIGQVRIQLGDYAKARIALERYLKDGEGKIPPARQQSVANDLDMLAGRTATLKIDCAVEGAEVTIDGESVGTTPLAAPILMNSGEHNIEVRKANYQTRVLRRTLAGKDEGEVTIELDKIPSAAPQVAIVAPPPTRTAPAPRSMTPIWAGWITTGVLTTGAVVTGILGISAADDLAKQKNQVTSSSDLHSTQRRAQTLLYTNDALTAAAVIAGSISLYLTLKSPSSSDEHRDATSLGLRFSANGVALSGRY
jgi:tetratricopeptide (TPR) repeat protein